ncbi:uncharacterized protein LOC132602235 isoform X2 [Lycium barbarum]|uniref:uncharacterized protein LOC132602235 isoform X2 n=1 Tax=Lycium barbarum TaxID=112863 RepID=UPI00293E448B|nr:uncharacterized protein LOC132602235 isoform X2 [Lycium barbarum]
MPKAFIDRVFTEILLPQFFFRIDQERAKSHVDSSLNNKWKEFRLKLWRAAWDPLKSKEEIIRKVPTGIPMDQWALFANYRLKEETQALCKKNQQSRQQQKIPHTSGAKSLARIRAEMENMGKEVDRGKVWIETHRRKDGNYVNDAAREVGERIEEIRSQRSEGLTEISPHDALGVVFGPEHPGRVRGLGMGIVPTVAFNKTSRRGGRFYMGSSNASAPPPQWQQEMADMRSQLNALTNLYRMNIGNIPEEFNHLFPTPPQAQDSGSARSPVGPRRFSDRSNYGDRASGN